MSQFNPKMKMWFVEDGEHHWVIAPDRDNAIAMALDFRTLKDGETIEDFAKYFFGEKYNWKEELDSLEVEELPGNEVLGVKDCGDPEDKREFHTVYEWMREFGWQPNVVASTAAC